MQLYPLKFQPILVERVWGGQALARYGKPVPPGKCIGESWELADRDEAQSIVVNGPCQGQTLRQLVHTLGRDLLGANCPSNHQFPLLIKLLDARERLSLQVHPPIDVAQRLGGEPKTEMWYILEAQPDAHLIAGLREGVTRQDFESAIRQTPSPVADLVHRFPVSAGDSLFVPSGRLHAIDAGLVILEIQQNSDTTYRVFDWNRVGLDGQPRTLHIEESLASINFNDFTPGPNHSQTSLANAPEFQVEKVGCQPNHIDCCDGRSFHVLNCIAGQITIQTSDHTESLTVGELALLPAALGDYRLTSDAMDGSVLKTRLPENTAAR